MYWYEGMVSMHRWLAIASAVLFLLRAVGVLGRIAWLTDGRARLAQGALDVPLTISGLSLWALLALHPLANPWLGLKLLALGAYIGFGALALRAPEREAELFWLLLALLALGAMFALSLTRDPLMGLA